MEYTYIFLHSDDADAFFSELKESERLKLSFTKQEHTEIFAVGERVTVGKYDKVTFFLFEGDFSPPEDSLGLLKVRIEKAGEGFRDFAYGKFKIERDTLVKLDVQEDAKEKLLLDLIPALHILLVKIKILLNQCNLQSESMSKEESKIIAEVSKLSHAANNSKSVSDLEDILSKVSDMHTSFFGKFARFKDVNEEIFLLIVKFESLSREMGNWYDEKIQEFKNIHQSLLYFESKFEQSLNGVRDLFSIISLQLDTMRNRENMDLQRRTSSLQAAAAIIEFVAVFYYTLKIWEHFLPIEKLPGPLAFLLLTSFTISVVAYTELLAEFVRFGRITKTLIAATLLIALLLLLMLILPITFSGALSPSSAH